MKLKRRRYANNKEKTEIPRSIVKIIHLGVFSLLKITMGACLGSKLQEIKNER
ncbi:hypothetical protein N9F17_01335 [Salibacteraceae bacterium]|nr:hypothetical protein [Salibacteraceae bacterium]